jgi:hypothetical protein
MRQAWVIVFGTLALAGCSAAQVFEKMPREMGGLSAEAPKPPDKPYLYPAVHDVPGPREVKTLSDQEQLKLEQDLLSARNSQEQAVKADAEAQAAQNAAQQGKR